jgi:signal transduction histidine kinase
LLSACSTFSSDAGLQEETSDADPGDRGRPFNRLRQRLERALAAPREAAMDTATLEAAIAELDEVLATFAAMLRIAQTEAGVRRGLAELDLSELVQGVAEIYQAVAEERGARPEAEVTPDQRMQGDAALLRQLLVNLIENALAHGGAAVRTPIAQRPGPVLEVADNGPGIPEEEREKMLRRFYRLDHNRGTPGSGLGLALVAAVAKLHGASLSLGDARPGLRVTVAFPPQG